MNLYEGSYIDSYNRLSQSPKGMLESRVILLRRLQDALSRYNVRMLFIISPSKASVYPEYIPDRYVLRWKLREKDDYQVILPMLYRHGVAFMDSRKIMLEMKEEGHENLFPSSGIHWSHLGACLITEKMILRMERLLKRRLVHVGLGEIIISSKPVGQDRDIARLCNILDTASLFTEYAYPETRPLAAAGAFRPNLLIIGSSFSQNIVYYLEKNGICSNIGFYYYFNTEYSYPGRKIHPIDRKRLNWGAEVLSRDIVIIECNETHLKEVGFGFIEAALKNIDHR